MAKTVQFTCAEQLGQCYHKSSQSLPAHVVAAEEVPPSLRGCRGADRDESKAKTVQFTCAEQLGQARYRGGQVRTSVAKAKTVQSMCAGQIGQLVRRCKRVPFFLHARMTA